MRILTNPGANLPPELVSHYRIDMTGAKIVVDGREYDCREDIPLEQVDGWVNMADEHPYVLGTSAAEIARHCLELAEHDDEILVAMSSRKIIQSYDSARSAARTLESHPVGRNLRIRVVDSTATDLGLGLPILAAAEAGEAGLGVDEAADLFDTITRRGEFVFVARTLDNLIRGGRASFLRGWMAKMLGLRPVLAFVDREPQMVGKVGVKDDHPRVLAEWIAQRIRGRVWIGVAHGNAPEDAHRTADELRKRLDVVYSIVRPLTPSVYLHAGPRTLAAIVLPLDELPWVPPAPPR